MRVVVTGFGLLTAVGDNADECWAALNAGHAGIAENTVVSKEGVSSSLAGQVRSIAETTGSRQDRIIRLGIPALAEALERAGLGTTNPYDEDKKALVIGTCLGGARSGDAFLQQWMFKGLDHSNPALLLEYPLHAVADALAAKFGIYGPRAVHSNACAAGSVAVGHAFELLQDGMADVVIAGGVDSLAHLSFAGFSSLGALSRDTCAPYTRSDGLNLGEGSGFLILEDYDRAMDRGACAYAEILGFGLSADAYHPTAPDPRGRGAMQAVNSALRLSEIRNEDVDYVNGHGTGTPTNDSGELKTILSIGGVGSTPMSSTKSMTGHTLGAAGAVEAVVCVMTIAQQRIHPTYIPDDALAREKLEKIEKDGRIDIVPRKSKETEIEVALSNSFAFGGSNASVIFSKIRKSEAEGSQGLRREQKGVVITGFSAMAGSAANTEAVRAACQTGERLYRNRVTLSNGLSVPVGRSAAEELCKGINPRVLRRLDSLGLLAVHSFVQLLKDRPMTPAELSSTGVIFATGTGPVSTIESFQRGLINKRQGDSRLFPNTVMNAAAGHVAVAFGMRGPTATVSSGATSGVTALHLAHQLIKNRMCDRLVVVAADEAPDPLLAAYSRFKGYLSNDMLVPGKDSGVVYSSGAVSILLEASEVLNPGLKARGRVLGMGMSGNGSGAGGFLRSSEAWRRSFEAAIKRSDLKPCDIDVVISAANGRERTDFYERQALGDLGLSPGVPIVAPRGLTGELNGSGPLFGVPIAEWLKNGDVLRFDPENETRVAVEHEKPLRVLTSGFSIGGSFQSFVTEV